LINGEELILAKRNSIGEDEAKQMTVSMLVDPGAYDLYINETIQAELNLPVIEKRKAQLANSYEEEYDVVAPTEARFQNRRCFVAVFVLRENSEPLLGSSLVASRFFSG
jgi:predicted aspartyl protease